MSADGSSPTRLTTNSASDYAPSWSPDGEKIAFTSERNGTLNDDIYVMNANGGNLTRLTANTASNTAPSWSPDGTKIVFTSNRDGNDEIYAMNADGSSPTNLTKNAATDSNPSWSPDGTKIAFTSGRDGNIGGGNDEIYVMNANGGNQTRLTTNAATDSDPSWSPNGTKIAFTSGRDGFGDEEIYIMSANGANQTRLTKPKGHNKEPDWSPDGTKIAFVSWRDLNWEIYVMNASGSSQTRLTHHTPGGVVDLYPSWQPTAADRTPPNTTITNHPASSTTSTAASFSFSSSESDSSFGCRLDAGAWSACSSPKAYSGLACGSHTFQVRAVDAAHNVDSTPASYSWTVASSPPPGSASGMISSAHLTKTSFKRSQAAKVMLLYSFSPQSKHFSYLLSLKKKATWLTVQSVAKTGSFNGSYTITVKKLFAGKAIKAGSYRLKLSADKNSKQLAFRVT
jgi:hypothetical protein